jgi:hypothetical protein
MQAVHRPGIARAGANSARRAPRGGASRARQRHLPRCQPRSAASASTPRPCSAHNDEPSTATAWAASCSAAAHFFGAAGSQTAVHRPAVRDELADAAQRPARLELIQDVDQVVAGADPKRAARRHERVGAGEALGGVGGGEGRRLPGLPTLPKPQARNLVAHQAHVLNREGPRNTRRSLPNAYLKPE